MRPIRAIIADDEEHLRADLRKKLAAAWPELIISGEITDGIEAARLIEEARPEVAFLDIRMPGLSGIEVARKAAGTCQVVFVTAHDQYAVDAFESEALDYLLKPVTDERLEKTVKRLKERLASSSPAPDLSRVLDKLARTIERPSGRLQWIKAQHRAGIVHAEAIQTADRSRGGSYTITFKDVKERLAVSRAYSHLFKQM